MNELRPNYLAAADVGLEGATDLLACDTVALCNSGVADVFGAHSGADHAPTKWIFKRLQRALRRCFALGTAWSAKNKIVLPSAVEKVT